jgi:hypothetical protein
VFIPVSSDQLGQLATIGELAGPLPGFLPGPVLQDAFGVEPGQDELLDYAALQAAAVVALAQHGARIVVSAKVDQQRIQPGGQDQENGGVLLDFLNRADITAFFTESGPDDLVAQARLAAQGKSLDDAWEQDAVGSLVAWGAPAWHDVSEL